MALPLPPSSLSQRQLLMGYLNGDLDAETSAWFEAWLLTQEPLIELLDRYNDARDALIGSTAQASGAHHPMTVDGRIGVWRQSAATGKFQRQHLGTTAGLLRADHRRKPGHYRGGGGRAIEEVPGSHRRSWIGFASGGHHIGSGSHAENLGSGVAPQRVTAHPAGQIEGTDGQHLGTRCRILDAVSLPVAIAGGGDDQHPVLARQPRERARQHARRCIPGTIESQAQGNDVGALGQCPCAGQFHRKTVAATTVFNDLGDQQARIGSHAIAATAIKGATGPGDDAGAGGAMAVSAAILDGTGSHQRNAAGNPVTAEIGVPEIHPTVEHGNAHAVSCRPVGVQTQRLRRQHAGAWIGRHTVSALSKMANALGTIHAQGATPNLVQQPPAVERTHEHRTQSRHEQGRAIAAPEPEADQVFDQLGPAAQQIRRLSRRQA